MEAIITALITIDLIGIVVAIAYYSMHGQVKYKGAFNDTEWIPDYTITQRIAWSLTWPVWALRSIFRFFKKMGQIIIDKWREN